MEIELDNKSNLPSSKIGVITILEFLGVKMAHFYGYERAGTKIEARPVGMRSFPLLKHIPYWVGTKPDFVIRCKTGKQMINATLPVYQWWPGMRGESQVGRIGPFIVEGEIKDWPISGFNIPADGTLEFWIDQPKVVGSTKIADFKGNWKDQGWLIAFAGAMGFIIGVVGDVIVTMIKEYR